MKVYCSAHGELLRVVPGPEDLPSHGLCRRGELEALEGAGLLTPDEQDELVQLRARKGISGPMPNNWRP